MFFFGGVVNFFFLLLFFLYLLFFLNPKGWGVGGEGGTEEGGYNPEQTVETIHIKQYHAEGTTHIQADIAATRLTWPGGPIQ